MRTVLQTVADPFVIERPLPFGRLIAVELRRRHHPLQSEHWCGRTQLLLGVQSGPFLAPEAAGRG
jgi:hypothetical protein